MTLCLKQCSPCCVSVGPNLVWSCCQSVPSCSMSVRTDLGILGLPCASHGFNLESIWIALGPTSAQHDQFNWRQLDLQLGPRHRNLGPSWAPVGAAPGKVGPNPSQFCGLNVTRWKLVVSLLFPTFFAFIGLVLGPTSAPDAPTQDLVAHAKPNLRPNVPKLRHVGPQLGSSWSQLARVRRKLRPSWTQVGSCSVELRAKDGQVWPQSTFGWAK